MEVATQSVMGVFPILAAAYLSSLGTRLYEADGIAPGVITLTVIVTEVACGLDTAIPGGLSCNALCANAPPHAFSHRQAGGQYTSTCRRRSAERCPASRAEPL